MFLEGGLQPDFTAISLQSIITWIIVNVMEYDSTCCRRRELDARAR